MNICFWKATQKPQLSFENPKITVLEHDSTFQKPQNTYEVVFPNIPENNPLRKITFFDNMENGNITAKTNREIIYTQISKHSRNGKLTPNWFIKENNSPVSLDIQSALETAFNLLYTPSVTLPSYTQSWKYSPALKSKLVIT